MSTPREKITPHEGDSRYIRRDDKGRISESVDVGKSSAADQRQHSEHEPKRGHGDEGDRKKS